MANVIKQIEKAVAYGDDDLLSVVDSSKAKGKQTRKNSFFWEKYIPSLGGKRGIMKTWDKEFAIADDTITWVNERGELQCWRKGNTPKNYKKQESK